MALSIPFLFTLFSNIDIIIFEMLFDMGRTIIMKNKFVNKVNNSKIFKTILFFLIIIYVVIGFILFASFFVSINAVKSIVINSDFWSKILSLFINDYSNIISIAAISINVTLTFIFFILKEATNFPVKTTIISLGFNSAVCISVKAIFYIVCQLNIFLDFQILYILPLITIIFSSVFLIYDFVEYYRGTYRPIKSIVNLPTKEIIQETIEIISNRSKFIPYNNDSEKVTNENKTHNINLIDSKNYRTEHGYFNNEALEMAASHIISTVDRNHSSNDEQNDITN